MVLPGAAGGESQDRIVLKPVVTPSQSTLAGVTMIIRSYSIVSKINAEVVGVDGISYNGDVGVAAVDDHSLAKVAAARDVKGDNVARVARPPADQVTRTPSREQQPSRQQLYRHDCRWWPGSPSSRRRSPYLRC